MSRVKIATGNVTTNETLEVRFKGENPFADVLNMTINQAVEFFFFENIPSLSKNQDVARSRFGLYQVRTTLTTLSSGESQQLNYQEELAKRIPEILFIFWMNLPPVLHFEDINVLLGVLNRLVDKGNTLIVIEHNMDVIKCADHIIDIGMEGGVLGGQLICEGTPEVVKQNKGLYSRIFKKELK